MALSPQPDIRFFRNTGLTLVTATLMAGAITLSLTLKSGSTLVRNAEGQMEKTSEIAGSVVATTGAGPAGSSIIDGSFSFGGLAEPLQEKVLN